ncbi:glutaredoxin family protein [Patescibacteria group bacterium]
MSKITKFFTLTVLSFVLLFFAFKLHAESPNTSEVYFFYVDTCPYCQQTMVFLANLVKNNPLIEVSAYNIGDNIDNQGLFYQMGRAYGISADGVPTLFIGDKVIDAYYPAEIENAINNCLTFKCISPEERLKAYQKFDETTENYSIENYLKLRWLLIGLFVVFVVIASIFHKTKDR